MFAFQIPPSVCSLGSQNTQPSMWNVSQIRHQFDATLERYLDPLYSCDMNNDLVQYSCHILDILVIENNI